MTNFSEELLIDGDSFHFRFSKVFSPTYEKVFVVVKGEQVVEYFEMKKMTAAQWKVLQPAPAWIVEIEKELSEILFEKGV